MGPGDANATKGEEKCRLKLYKVNAAECLRDVSISLTIASHVSWMRATVCHRRRLYEYIHHNRNAQTSAYDKFRLLSDGYLILLRCVPSAASNCISASVSRSFTMRSQVAAVGAMKRAKKVMRATSTRKSSRTARTHTHINLTQLGRNY